MDPSQPSPSQPTGVHHGDAGTEAGHDAKFSNTSTTPTVPTALPEPGSSSMIASLDGTAQPPLETSGGRSKALSVTSDRRSSTYGSSQQNPNDRVFPIRSVVSVDPADKTSGDNDYFGRVALDTSPSTTRRPGNIRLDTGGHARHKAPEGGEASQQQRFAQNTSLRDVLSRRRRNESGGAISSVQADADRYGNIGPLPLFTGDASDDEGEDTAPTIEAPMTGSPSVKDSIEGFVTTQFRHVVTDDGHAVITGREGTLQRCEDEPIHTPGAVQGFGLLLAIREEADGRFSVRYVSENSGIIIGYSPRELFRLESFLDILSDEQAGNLLDHIDFIRDEDADAAASGPEVFSISIRPPHKKSSKLWCAIHISPTHPDLIICEFEHDDDHNFPLRPSEDLTPDLPEDTLRANPTAAELAESTEILSKPLRVLRSARKRRGEAGAMQVFDIMSQVQEQLASAPNLETFLKVLVGIVKELTGFHRVMIYQFDSSFNGKVVTELVDATQTRDLYKGLHFPAWDIPKQARDLYKLNKVRLLYDRDLETAKMVCRSVEDLKIPLDMTHAYLRAMSPVHLKYLGNMAVRASMSISINAFSELWGLIACHSYGMKGMRVSFPIRKMCRLVGDTVSRNIERLSYASRLQARKLINTVPTDQNPSGYIIASSDDLLKLFGADFGMLCIKGETKILGRLEQTQEALAMLEYLRLRKFTSVVTSQNIREDFPDLRYAPGFTVVAGLLYVPLSVGGNDFIVFFRKGQVKEVKWAGNPYEKTVKEGTSGYLEPRASFKTWHETVVGICREWSEEQVETAAVLCLVYGKFIEVWRQKEAALQNSRLTRLLLANSAHEVRTPLNAIINYLEIALEGSLEQETRDYLAKSHSASKSLIYVINDLLDLTKAEKGQELVKDEIFGFPACVREATEPFRGEAKRKGVLYEVIEHPGLPQYVFGDQRRVRQAVSNVVANAVQHTDKGSVQIEMYLAEMQERRALLEIVVTDTGQGMKDSLLDALFRDLEQVTTEQDETGALDEEGKGVPESSRTLGLGLAVVARIVRNMDGQLRLKSEEGKGSRFVIQFPFELPPDDSPGANGRPGAGSVQSATSNVPSLSTTIPHFQDGEVTLVDRASLATGFSNAADGKSFDDGHSISSQRTATSKASHGSTKSDADRLIDAIQMPLALGEPDAESPILRRQRSRGLHHGPATGDHADRSRSPSSQVAPQAAPGRAASIPEQPDVSQAEDGVPTAGVVYLTGSRTPIKAVKIPDELADQPESRPQAATASRVLFELPSSPPPSLPGAAAPSGAESRHLRVLIAEDDPVNFRLLSKRLGKAGHAVLHAVNGDDCAQMYAEKSKVLDVVLMDMQMPILDGLASTKRIRESEQSDPEICLSSAAARNGRIPVFAVSASLVESNKGTYVEAGFDGWILKPVDFKRLETLLSGIHEDGVRNKCLYQAGQWEQGGWFGKRAEPTGAADRVDAGDQAEHIEGVA